MSDRNVNRRLNMKSFVVIAALVAAGVVVAGEPAFADSTVSRQVVRVDHRELSTQQGLMHVYRRLNQAATVVCGNYESSALLQSQAYRQCLNDAVSQAVAQIHDARLTRYHESLTTPGATPVAAFSADPVARR
jgi:UrcA family protein